MRGWNTGGAGAWSPVWSFTTSGLLAVSFDVLRTWNLVSLPVRPDDLSVTSLFPTAMTSAYGFSNAVGYAQTDMLTPGAGYWLRFPTGTPVSMTGTPVLAETVAVSAGWNLIGALRDSVPVGAVRTVPDGILASAFFGYGTGYAVATTLAPGHGYWVSANASGVVIVSSSTSAAAKSSAEATTELARADRLTLRDALGREQDLYLSDGAGVGTPRSWYAMPPLPPTGVMDARFSSDRYLESYPASSQDAPEITVRSAVAPLSVRAHLRPGSPLKGIIADGVTTLFGPDGEATIASVDGPIRLLLGKTPGVPLAFALATVPTTLGIVWIAAHQMNMAIYVTNLVTLIGIGIAIDYSLLVVYRFREELARGHDRTEAVVRTMETAGRAVVFSGGTVAIGLAMLLFIQGDYPAAEPLLKRALEIREQELGPEEIDTATVRT